MPWRLHGSGPHLMAERLAPDTPDNRTLSPFGQARHYPPTFWASEVFGQCRFAQIVGVWADSLCRRRSCTRVGLMAKVRVARWPAACCVFLGVAAALPRNALLSQMAGICLKKSSEYGTGLACHFSNSLARGPMCRVRCFAVAPADLTTALRRSEW
jgi:hypothetical protein